MRPLIKLSLSVAAGAIAVPAAAQTAEDASANVGETIIVTATKRSENILDVPIAITALTGDELEQRGITTVSDLQYAVPGLTMREDGPGSNTIFLRGIANQYGNGAVVGQYLDEVPVTLTALDQLDVRGHDLERIEVLKGPQGTLYGQGSVAGTVRYITKKPVLDHYEGSLSGTLFDVEGGDLGWTVENVLNIPVAEDRLGLRVASRFGGGGGWQDQPAAGIEDGNDDELINIRAKMLWRVTDALDVEFMYIFHRAEAKLGLGYEDPDRTIFVAGDPATVLIPKIQKNHIGNMTITADLGFAELVSATSYIDNDHQRPFAYECGPETNCAPYQGNDDPYDTGELFTQEVRLASTGNAPLQWTVGFFYADLKDDLVDDYRTFYPVPPDPYTSIFTDRYVNETTSESYAIFGDVSYQLSDRLLVGVGGRYFHDKQTDATSNFVFLVPDLTEQSGSFDDFNPRAYIKYDVTDTVNLYASVGTGFRSGGFNSPGDPTYDPEAVLTYEIGAKGRSADGRVTFELAAFYNDYSDMLRRGLVFNGTNFTSQLSNIGDVDIYGLEGGIAFEAVPGFTISATGAWLDTEVKEIRADDATNLPGDPLDYVPEITFSLSGHYEFDWGADLPGFARVDYFYRDKVSYIDRTTFLVVPQYSDSVSLLSARVGAEFDQFTLEVFGTNLTNENRWVDPYHQWRNANRTRPRTLGVKVGVEF